MTANLDGHEKIGAILVRMGAITPEQLQDALTAQAEGGRHQLVGQILLAKRYCSFNVLAEALAEQGVALLEGEGG